METLTVHKVNKTYQIDKQYISAIEKISISILQGEQLGIVGPSGSGKSTLLHIMGGLLQPSSGTVVWDNQDIWSLSQTKRARLRAQHIGFVYQSHNLLPDFSALENVAIPLLVSGQKTPIALEKAKIYLKKVGLQHRELHKPSQLSGGERQRVAIARALCNNPRCILADEPTGNLDTKTSESIFETLMALTKEDHLALVIVTHNEKIAENMAKQYVLKATQ